MPHRIPFRLRAREVSRLEAFSDVIFGFSISLLVVSLEAPKTYHELMEMLHGFLPFILFYVYPLKYMFTLVTGGGERASIPPGGYRVLFTVYGLGFTAVFWLLAA